MTDTELRALAERATQGPHEWKPTTWYGTEGGWCAVGPHHLGTDDGDHETSDEPGSDCHEQAKRDAAYLSAANPAAILALLDRAEIANVAMKRLEAGIGAALAKAAQAGAERDHWFARAESLGNTLALGTIEPWREVDAIAREAMREGLAECDRLRARVAVLEEALGPLLNSGLFVCGVPMTTVADWDRAREALGTERKGGE